MKVLFLTHYELPHIGGVERHVYEVSKSLKKKGVKVTTISQKDINYPNIKILGLLYIWFWLFKNRNLIKSADIIHCHDVFIWYLPFRFIYPNKKIITTIHGWEELYPLPFKYNLLKKIASMLSAKIVGVGIYLEKYIHIKFDLITYGSASVVYNNESNVKKGIVYVGRLEKNTGLSHFLDWVKDNHKHKVDFCGEGHLQKECTKYGKVHGFTNPIPFYKKSKICVPGGYLAAFEALYCGCELKLFWDNKIKESYWKLSPFYKLKGKALKKWAREQTWDKLANEYLNLYNNA